MGTIQLSPQVAPFQRIKNPGENITINTAGKVLVIPTGDAVKLPNFNEYALNSNRLTIAESPFGGLKGAGSPDYAVGTIYTPTDGVYITDTSGTNSTKTMTAGKLKELSLLTVNTTAKTISEEFIIANLNTANGTLQSIDPCNDHTGWAVAGTFGTGVSFSSDGSTVTVTGTCDASGYLIVEKTLSSPVDLTNYPFAIFNLKSSRAGTAMLGIGSSNSNYSRWSNKTCTALTANTQAAAVLPIKAPGSSTSTISNPNIVNGSPNWAAVAYLRIGYFNATYANQAVTLTFYDISADVGKAANVEINVPDSLDADSSISVQCWDGSAYQVCRVCKLDPIFADVSTTPANVKTQDGTKLDDVYGSTLGRGVFPKGIQGATVTGNNSLTTTYSGNKGTKYRIGKMVLLPPSDGGRTNFNKIRLKFVITYSNSGATSYEFDDSLNTSYGLQNMIRPWIALYDPTLNYIDFFLFNHRPKNLIRRRDDTGNIYELTLYPGNGSIYRGRITHANLTTDTNSNLIPNCLEAAVDGSITKFLQSFGFAQDEFLEYDLSTSAITANDFSLTSTDLDIIPFAISEGDSLSNLSNVRLPIFETVATESGNISIIDVRGLTGVRFRDTSYTNAGDCLLFDSVTVNDTNRNNWKRVLSTSWVFTGDCVAENGLLRVKSNATACETNIWPGTGSTYTNLVYTAEFGTFVSVAEISTDKIVINTTLGTITLRKGFRTLITSGRLKHGFNTRFAISNDTVFDAFFDPVAHTVTIDSNSYYGMILSPTSTILAFMARATAGGFLTYVSGNLCTSLTLSTATPARGGAIPFTCSKLYYEAEAAVTGNYYRDTLDLGTDADAYPATGNTCAYLKTQNQGCGVIFDSNIPSGTYKLYFRVKRTGTVAANDFKIKKQLNAGGSESDIVASVVPGLTFEYISCDYTHDAAGDIWRVWLTRNSATDANNYLALDYILMAPNSLIEKHAKRSLWTHAPFTKTFKSINR